MIETKYARMVEFGLGDVDRFGQSPERKSIRKWRHQVIVNNEVLHGSHQPHEFLEGLLLALGMGAIYEYGKAKIAMANERMAELRDQLLQEKDSSGTRPVLPTASSSKSYTEHVYGVGSERWERARQGGRRVYSSSKSDTPNTDAVYGVGSDRWNRSRRSG